jgi:hypothetical protein
VRSIERFSLFNLLADSRIKYSALSCRPIYDRLPMNFDRRSRDLLRR